MASCLVGIGSNLGDRAALVERALVAMADLPQTVVVARSKLHETAPIGGPAEQPTYLNAAALLATELAPFALLDHLQRIEHELGRVRTEHWASRTIDLDLLLYDELEIASDRLTLPHPRFAWRRFALAPAAEIASDLRHPTIHWNVGQLLANLDRAETYVAILGLPGGAAPTLAQEVAHRLQARFLQTETSDPASPSLASHLKSLSGRRLLLERETWPPDDRLSIGDFSLVESWIAASLSLPADDLPQVDAPWEAAIAETVSPKLYVFVDEPGRPSGNLDLQWLERFRDELALPHGLPWPGPLLIVQPGGREGQVAEIVTAVESMQ